MHKLNIVHDYALVKAPRDLSCGMYTQMSATNYMRHVKLHYFVIIGHKRSQNVTER